MPEYFKTYHLLRYLLLAVTLWCALDIYGSFTVGRVHAHRVQAVKVQRQRQNELKRKQTQMSQQVPGLLKQVRYLQAQATHLDQQTKHVILPSDAQMKQKGAIYHQVKRLQSKIERTDHDIAGSKRLRTEYQQLQRTTDGYGF